MKVSPGEKLTRFIRYNSHFDEPNTVSHEAFLPRKDQVDISVFRISALPDSEALSCSEVWKIGEEHVATKERPVKARADLLASSVYESELEVSPSEPPDRHASIAPLPAADSKANKLKRRSLATKLANASKLVMPPVKN